MGTVNLIWEVALMGMHQHQGYKRLASGIAIVTFIANAVLMFFWNYDSTPHFGLPEFIVLIVASAIISGISYLLVWLTYWIIAGFAQQRR
jgi:hypothetical protein